MVLALIGIVTIACGLLAERYLGINTDTTNMLSRDLAFRRDYEAYREAFPQFRQSLFVIIEAPDDAAALAAAQSLAHMLTTDQTFAAKISAPFMHPFFRSHGLLYQDKAHISTILDQLIAAAPFLGALTADPSARAIANLTKLMLRDANSSNFTPEPLRNQETIMLIEHIAEAAQGPQPMLWQRLIRQMRSSDTSPARRIIFIQPFPNHDDIASHAKIMAKIRAYADQLELDKRYGALTELTGSVALRYEELVSVSHGIGLASLVSLVLVAIVLVIGVRAPTIIASIGLILLCGLVWTSAFAALAFGELNLISVAFAVFFIGLGVDFGIHFGLRIIESSVMPSVRDIERAARDVSPALLLCTVTSSFACLAFAPTAYLGLAQLGIIAAVGLVCALTLTLTLMPAWLALYPPRITHLPLSTMTNTVCRPKLGRDRIILLFVAAVTLLSLLALPDLSFDSDPMNLRSAESESVRAWRKLSHYVDETPEQALIILPTDSNILPKITRALKAQSEIGSFSLLDSLFPPHEKEKRALILNAWPYLADILSPPLSQDQPSLAELTTSFEQLHIHASDLASDETASPPMRAVSDQLAGAIERALLKDTLIYALAERLTGDLESVIHDLQIALAPRPLLTLKDIPADIQRDFISPSGLSLLTVRPSRSLEDQETKASFVRALTQVVDNAGEGRAHLTGAPAIEQAASIAVLDAFSLAAGITLIGVPLLVMIAMRHFQDMILIFLPLALTACWTMAASVMLNLPFNFANLIVLPLLFGLGVDSGIHMVTRARHSHSYIGSTTTPRAIIVSNLTTILSFASLGLSDHQGTASMGMMLTIAISFNLLASLIALPAVLRLLDHRNQPPTQKR